MVEAVLVAGAGPVGLTMAMSLKRCGVDVRIVDPAPERTDKSKALVIWPRTLELLDIQGCTESFVATGLEGRGTRIFSHGRELVHVTFDGVPSAYKFPLMIPQSDTERLLEAELQSLNLRVERRVSLKTFEDEGSQVRAELLHPDGTVETARFAYLAGCDGAHSVVRHTLGVPFEGSTEQSDWVLADLHIDGDIVPDELGLYWAPTGLLAFFPVGRERFRVIADRGASTGKTVANPTLDEVQQIVDSRGPTGLRVRDPVWLSGFRINERKVKDYRVGRVFLSGDAAHVHSPAGGQGMNTGMQDAFNLAWKLALVTRGAASETLLDSYSPERSAIGDMVLRNASAMTHVATLQNPILREIRNAAAGVLSHIPALRQRLVEQLCELDLNYEKGPLTAGSHGLGHPANGHRAPDVELSGGGRLYGVLRGPAFALLSVGTPPLSVPGDLTGVVVSAGAESNAAYPKPGHLLVRPDGYIAASSDPEHGSDVVDHLRKVLGR